MKASHNLARVSVNFDEDRLVPNGGLTVAALLAQKLGVGELVDEYVTLSGDGAGNSGAKALTVVGSALVGGDCIDDANVLRAGATPLLLCARAVHDRDVAAAVRLGEGALARPGDP